MSILNKKMLSSAAAVALFAALPSAAFAFDSVNWTWGKTVVETVDIDVDVTTDVDTTGLTQVEKLQVQIGDVNATSYVNGITNNQPVGEGGGVGSFNEVFDFATMTNDGTDPSTVVGPVGGVGDGDTSGVSATLLDGGTLDEGTDDLNFQVEVSGTVTVAPTGSLDAAVDLPSIESAATAVGNNQSISSDVATYLHDGQFLFDTHGRDVAFDEIDAIGGIAAIALGSEFVDNSHTAFAVGASVLGITGTIDKAEVRSISSVSNILNASVDGSATSVGNNVSVDVNADGTPNGDSVLIADMTQFALADISAVSGVNGVTVNNYTNLASVNPLVSSAATAVGNNVSINVGNVGGL